MHRFRLARVVWVGLLGVWLGTVTADEVRGAEPIEHLDALVPGSIAELAQDKRAEWQAASSAVDRRAAELVWSAPDASAEQVLSNLRQLIGTKRRVDEHLEKVLALRTQFVAAPNETDRHDRMCRFLQVSAQLIDLSGRLRYSLRDAIDRAAFDLDDSSLRLEDLVRMLIEQRVKVGAGVLAEMLVDPPANSDLKPFPLSVKRRVIELMGVSRQFQLVSDLAEFLRRKDASAELRLAAALAIREIGVPQEPRAGQDPSLPKPATTASELHGLVSRISTGSLSVESRTARDDLLTWLAQRQKKGVLEETFRVGEVDVRAGDWLLMRNPSPYNLFTDLTPGLFTHVGVVAVETGADGFRRFVIVDLPERGDRIPATNVDVFLPRTLHYFLIRHDDAAVAAKLGDAAVQMIGNASQFDLQFRTERVTELKGRPLRGARIHTYCAGFLLLCAQETPWPRDHFFPFTEAPAGGHCSENLRKLGLSIGNDFISPTGAIFSPHLEIAGRCEPMYEPTREIRERIFDHFAHSMIDKQLTPSPDTLQALRTRLAAAAKRSPLLAKALAKANNVSEHTDLESAAKAAAVVETLDDIAERNSAEFDEAREAMTAGTRQQLLADGLSRADIARIERLRQVHATLYKQWTADRLSPRELRLALVEFYASQGERQLNERFFR